MDYTIKNGRFYKVIENKKMTSVGIMSESSLLSTIHEVVFITKEEYTELTGIEVKEEPKSTAPEPPNNAFEDENINQSIVEEK